MGSEATNDMRPISRFITDHDKSGNAIFSTALDETLPMKTLPDGAMFGLGYATNIVPVEMNEGRDLDVYSNYLSNLPGVMIPGGVVCRVVDMRPNATSPMHRTVSIDFGVVLEGEVEIILDSGETRLMKRGDVAVQRGTMHAWRNTSQTRWARMLYVLHEANPVNVGGGDLIEDYGGIPGVRPSKN